MFDELFTYRKPITSFTISQKNPLAVTCEKITLTPRVFNTAQLNGATENIVFSDLNEDLIPEELIKSMEFIFKDFFVYMHQTGLYNRQFKLWKTMGSVISASVYCFCKGVIKKTELPVYVIDFFIDPKNPCITLIFDKSKEENEILNFSKFRFWVSESIKGKRGKRLKGIFYLTDKKIGDPFLFRVGSLIDCSDLISKYESLVLNTNDVRLNVILCEKKESSYNFRHIFPEIKHPQKSKLKNTEEVQLYG